ncbi:hypothetical protein V6N13_027190 [Hibiscus sabdariffa]
MAKICTPDSELQLLKMITFLVCSRGGPFDSKDEIVVTVPIQLVNSSLSILSVHKVDETEPSTRARLLIHGDVHTSHGTEWSEKFVQVGLPGVL